MPRGPQNRRKERRIFRLGILRLRYYLNLYTLAMDVGIAAAARILGESRQIVLYWVNKFQDETFHANSHGGCRWAKWNGEERIHLLNSIWRICKQNPLAGIPDFQIALQTEYGFDDVPSHGWLSALFKKWRWSFKKPDVRRIQKYSEENIAYYATYLYCIQDIPWNKLKFCDESHFDSRGKHLVDIFNENSDCGADLRKKTILSPINHPARVVTEIGPISKRYTLTLMTSLSETTPFPLFFSLREETNTADAFLEFVTFAIERQYLVDGDYLVVDNAPIHTAVDELATLVNLLEAYNIHLIFLPTYSPELNPCELCFSFIKRAIRERSNPRNGGFDAEIVKTCLKVTPDHVFNFYSKSIIDPLFTK